MIELFPEDDQIRVAQYHPDKPLAPDPILQLNREQAVELAENLLRWAYKDPVDAPRRHTDRDWDGFPSRLASHLWEHSALRHGMFTPPQFSDLCEAAIRSFFLKPKS